MDHDYNEGNGGEILNNILDKLNGIHELKIGESFTRPETSAYHTIKYDFKPASLDAGNNCGTLEVEPNNQISIQIPNQNSQSKTVFKGSKKLTSKECVLIIDQKTNEIRLERITDSIQVKKTREYNDRNKQSYNSSVSSVPTTLQPPVSTPTQEPSGKSETKKLTNKSSSSSASSNKIDKKIEQVEHLPEIIKSPAKKPIEQTKATSAIRLSESSSDSEMSSISSDSENDQTIKQVQQPAAKEIIQPHSSSDSSSSDDEMIEVSEEPKHRAVGADHLLNEDLNLSESESDSD